ncbi:Sec-independent protein translocase subunit TatA [Streptomyces rugosispiralis]|uniref:Sec-independent protein translocase protein TatA n=1 Tax=Streptomyces rugosispiralis TaxID=2967341 RepID=A0ABT1UYT6_9ACTN|nr:Sec-independent protein translocase subunit TatA [Streptomyces rugosispiralis]MCQ8190279.1 Sec-independent protein translocase subunit TatA [Streptomyces rugosispiralis]
MLRNGLEPWHLLIVAIVFILLFGAKRLPDTARSLGKSLRILKSETKAMKEESGQAAATSSASTAADTAEQPSSRGIQAASGETSSARAVREDHTTGR